MLIEATISTTGKSLLDFFIIGKSGCFNDHSDFFANGLFLLFMMSCKFYKIFQNYQSKKEPTVFQNAETIKLFQLQINSSLKLQLKVE